MLEAGSNYFPLQINQKDGNRGTETGDLVPTEFRRGCKSGVVGGRAGVVVVIVIAFLTKRVWRASLT